MLWTTPGSFVSSILGYFLKKGTIASLAFPGRRIYVTMKSGKHVEPGNRTIGELGGRGGFNTFSDTASNTA